MSKAHRGKGLYERISKGRGTCPVCGRTGIKIIHSIERDGKAIEVCKICKANAKNQSKKVEAGG